MCSVPSAKSSFALNSAHTRKFVFPVRISRSTSDAISSRWAWIKNSVRNGACKLIDIFRYFHRVVTKSESYHCKTDQSREFYPPANIFRARNHFIAYRKAINCRNTLCFGKCFDKSDARRLLRDIDSTFALLMCLIYKRSERMVSHFYSRMFGKLDLINMQKTVCELLANIPC